MSWRGTSDRGKPGGLTGNCRRRSGRLRQAFAEGLKSGIGARLPAACQACLAGTAQHAHESMIVLLPTRSSTASMRFDSGIRLESSVSPLPKTTSSEAIMLVHRVSLISVSLRFALFLLIISFRISLNCSRISCSMKIFPTAAGIQVFGMASVRWITRVCPPSSIR